MLNRGGKKTKYWSCQKLLKTMVDNGAPYGIAFGERSNGKTYQAKEWGLKGFHTKELDIKGYIDDGSQLAIVRRWQDDFKGKRGATLFDDLATSGKIKEWTNGEWEDVYYYSNRWYLCKFDEKLNKRITDPNPFALGFAISTMEHDKSTSYPKVNKIVFDECITRGRYLPDEFVLFMNVVSTIVRDRDDVTILMLGNTVNRDCPYFEEMGLVNIGQMKEGDIDVIDYGESKTHVVVEYTTSGAVGKMSDKYFAFNNPKLQMITGGKWEMAIYPHSPCRYLPKDIVLSYFIVYSKEILQADIVCMDDIAFTFIHRKSTPIKNPDEDLIYSPQYDPRPNHKRRLTKPTTGLERKIATFFIKDKVFYQSNEVGEIVRNYLLWCQNETVIKK